MRDLSLNFVILCLILCGCVSNGSSGEYDYNMEMLRGKWEKPAVEKTETLYLEFNESTMKLYHYNENDQIKYLINGSYVINESTITAKDFTSGVTKNYYYYILNCNLIFFDDEKVGFLKMD